MNPNELNHTMKTMACATMILLLGAMTPLFSPVYGQTVWEGTVDNGWHVVDNWSNGFPAADGTNNPQIRKDGAVVNLTSAVTTRSLVVSGDGTTAPVLNITANLGVNFSPITVGSSGSETGFGGVVNHTQGTVNIGGTSGTRRLNIAASAAANTSGNSGTYNLGGVTEGTAPTLSGMASGLVIGSRSGENGLFSLSDYGTITSAAGVAMSLYNGTSEWRIEGGNLNIDFTGGLSMGLSGGGSATITAIIDDTGFSTINLGGNVSFGSATLNPTRFVLELSDGYQHVHGREYVILDAVGDFTAHGVFGQVNGSGYTPGDLFTVGDYEFYADYRSGSSQFVVTAYIPEPSSGLLVLLGGLALLRRRRK